MHFDFLARERRARGQHERVSAVKSYVLSKFRFAVLWLLVLALGLCIPFYLKWSRSAGNELLKNVLGVLFLLGFFLLAMYRGWKYEQSRGK